MVNYNPVVQSIAGMGKVEQPEYVDTRITMDLSSLGKLAEQTTGGLMEGARFEREMLSAMDRANRNRKADQYAALKEQRAAEKHQWAAEKHQFAINAEERAQTKFEQEQVEKEADRNYARDLNTLRSMRDVNDMSTREFDARERQLADAAISSGANPITVGKIRNTTVGNVTGKIYEWEFEKEKEDDKNAVKWVDENYPESVSSLMTTNEKINVVNQTRAVSGEIENAVKYLQDTSASGIDSSIAVDNYIKASGNSAAASSTMAFAQLIRQANGTSFSEKDKYLFRETLANHIQNASQGYLSFEQAMAIAKKNTAVLDLPPKTFENLMQASGEDYFWKIVGNNELLQAVYATEGKKAVSQIIGRNPSTEVSVWGTITNLSNNTSNGMITLPNGETVQTSMAQVNWWNSMTPDKQRLYAPLIQPAIANTDNSVDTRIGAGNIILDTAKKSLNNFLSLYSQDTEDVNKAIETKDVSNLLGNLGKSIETIDTIEPALRNADIKTRREFSNSVNDLTYKSLALITESLKEYGFGTFIVYDPATNQILPTREFVENPGVIDKILQSTSQPWRMNLINNANELLKRVNRFSVDEKETKAFVENSMSDFGIETYDKNKHSVESPNAITKTVEAFINPAINTVDLTRVLTTAGLEYARTGEISAGTKAMIYADVKKLGWDAKNLGDFLYEQSVDLGEGLTQVGLGVKDLAVALSETEVFQNLSKDVKGGWESAKGYVLNRFNGSTEKSVENIEAAEDDYVEPTDEQTEQRVEQLGEIDEQSDSMFDENGNFKENVTDPEKVNQQLKAYHEAQQQAIKEAEMADEELMQNLESMNTTENNVSSENNKKDSDTESFKDPELQTLENIKTAGEVAGGGVAAAGAGYGAYKGGKSLYDRFADSVRTFYYTKINPNPAKIAERSGYSAEDFTEAYRNQQRAKAFARGAKSVAKGGLRGAASAIATDFALSAESNLDSLVRGASQERTKEFAAASLKDQKETIKLYNQFKKAAKTKEEKEAIAFYGYPDIYRIFIQKYDKDTIKELKKFKNIDLSPTPRTLEALVENYKKDKGKITDWLNNTSLAIERTWW